MWGARSLLVAGGGDEEVSAPAAVPGAGSVEGEATVEEVNELLPPPPGAITLENYAEWAAEAEEINRLGELEAQKEPYLGPLGPFVILEDSRLARLPCEPVLREDGGPPADAFEGKSELFFRLERQYPPFTTAAVCEDGRLVAMHAIDPASGAFIQRYYYVGEAAPIATLKPAERLELGEADGKLALFLLPYHPRVTRGIAVIERVATPERAGIVLVVEALAPDFETLIELIREVERGTVGS